MERLCHKHGNSEPPQIGPDILVFNCAGMAHGSPRHLFLESVKGIGANANSPLEKLCNWRALIEGHVMEVHSTGVQWPAPLQGPHLLIRGSPLPGKYAAVCMNIFTSSPTQTWQGRHCGLRYLFYFFSSRAARCFQEP